MTEDAPIWGLSLFRPFGAKFEHQELPEPFDQEIWGFLGLFWDFVLLWQQQHSRGSHGLWFVAAAAFPQPQILPGATEKWAVETAGKQPTVILCFN